MIKILARHKLIVFLFCFVVGIVVLYFINQIKPPFSITSTNPENESTKIMDDQSLEVSFDQPLNQKQQSKISILLEPPTSHQLKWKTDQILEINPQQPLAVNQQYIVSVGYGLKTIHEFSFSTNKFSQNDLKKQIIEQIRSDVDYSAARQKIDQDYPWLKHLPLETEEYVVVYDFDISSLRLHFKIPTPTQNIRNVIINKAIKKLSEVDINITQENLFIVDYQSP